MKFLKRKQVLAKNVVAIAHRVHRVIDIIEFENIDSRLETKQSLINQVRIGILKQFKKLVRFFSSVEFEFPVLSYRFLTK